MRKFNNNLMGIVLVIALMLGFTPPIPAHAATSPTLGAADSFSVIGATGITGTVPTSGITGNVGNPAGGQITDLTALMVGGTIQSFDKVAPGLATMNSNVMTDLTAAYGFLGTGGDNATCRKASTGDLGTDNGVIELGTKSLAPGVYCTDGSFQITAEETLTLLGTTGTWVFKAAEGLTTGVSSVVTGGDPCNVWWRMGTAAAGLGNSSTFIGTIIAHTGITFGVGVTLNGRALAEGANVTLNSGGTISGCAAPTAATLTLVKTISGGTRPVADFPLTATGPTMAITGVSDTADVTSQTVDTGTYTLSETTQADYTAGTWSCTNDIIVNGSSQITLDDGDTTTCTITNTYIIPPSSSRSGGRTTYGCKDPNASNYEYFAASDPSLCVYATATTTTAVIIAVATTTTPVFTPQLPNTGIAPDDGNIPLNIALILAGLSAVSIFFYFTRRKQTLV